MELWEAHLALETGGHRGRGPRVPRTRPYSWGNHRNNPFQTPPKESSGSTGRKKDEKYQQATADRCGQLLGRNEYRTWPSGDEGLVGRVAINSKPASHYYLSQPGATGNSKAGTPESNKQEESRMCDVGVRKGGGGKGGGLTGAS